MERPDDVVAAAAVVAAVVAVVVAVVAAAAAVAVVVVDVVGHSAVEQAPHWGSGSGMDCDNLIVK